MLMGQEVVSAKAEPHVGFLTDVVIHMLMGAGMTSLPRVLRTRDHCIQREAGITVGGKCTCICPLTRYARLVLYM